MSQTTAAQNPALLAAKGDYDAAIDRCYRCNTKAAYEAAKVAESTFFTLRFSLCGY